MLNHPQEPEDLELSIGELILIARNRANLSQEDLARRAEIGAITVWRYENGETMPTCDRLQRIAKATSHPVDWFYR